MLDAYLRKHARLPTHKSVDAGRRVIEDAITSTLFTPLRFMGATDVGQIIALLTGKKEDHSADACEVKLWSRCSPASNLSNRRFVEPDLMIDLGYSGVIARTIIEIKWDDVLGREQAETQVTSCASDLPGATFNHLSIVKFADLQALEYRGTNVRQWCDILRDLKGVRPSRSTTTYSKISLEWCQDAALFLEKLGIGTFVGFGKIDFRTVPQNISVPVFVKFGWTALRPIVPMTEKFSLIGN